MVSLPAKASAKTATTEAAAVETATAKSVAAKPAAAEPVVVKVAARKCASACLTALHVQAGCVAITRTPQCAIAIHALCAVAQVVRVEGTTVLDILQALGRAAPRFSPVRLCSVCMACSRDMS
jgi:hypothetical protein